MFDLYGADEEVVNVVKPYNQWYASVGIDCNSDILVAWDGYGTGDSIGIHARLLPSDGTNNDQFKVNTTTYSTQQFANVAMNSPTVGSLFCSLRIKSLQASISCFISHQLPGFSLV